MKIMKLKIILFIILFSIILVLYSINNDSIQKGKDSFSLNIIKSYKIALKSYKDEFGEYSDQSLKGLSFVGTNQEPIEVYINDSDKSKWRDSFKKEKPFIKKDKYYIILKIYNNSLDYWAVYSDKESKKLL